MEVEGAELRHAPDFLGKHPEGYDHEDVGLPGTQCLQELGILQLHGLQDRYAVLDSESLHRTLVDLEAASRGFVGDRDHACNLVPLVNQRLEWCYCKLGRTHVDDACLLEETDDTGLELTPRSLELVGVEGRILRGLPDQEGPYRD